MNFLNVTRKLCLHNYNIRFNSTKASNNMQYCLSMIKKRDYDNYLCILLLPPSLRLIGTAVRALNIELAMIQEQTSEQHTAKMRLEFWRRNIEQAVLGRPPNHPVLVTLALCMETYCDKISTKWITRLVDIRERYLDSRQFMSLSDVEEYGEYSVSSIFYLLLEAIENNDQDLVHAANHLGKAISFVTLLRSVHYFREKHKVILPVEICMLHNVSQQDIIRKTNTDKIREVIYDISSQGYIHLEQFKKLSAKKKHSSNIFLPQIPCEYFYKHIQKLDFDIYNERLDQRNWTISFKLLLASFKN